MTAPPDTPTITAHERHVIGAALNNPTVLDDLTALTPGDFHDWRLAELWTAIRTLWDEGHPVDALAVADHIARTGAAKDGGPDTLTRIGGSALIHELAAETVASFAAPWHAGRIRDAAMLRRVGTVGARLMGMAEQDVASQDEALAAVDAARAELDSLADVTAKVEQTHAEAVWASLDALDQPAGDPTPWPEVTKAIAGWKPGAFYLVGARPATGKSIAGVMAAVGMARHGKQAVMFSLEMTKTEVYHRMLVARAEVDMQRLQTRTLTQHDRVKLDEAAHDIAGLPLVVHDSPSMSVAQIRSAVRAASRDGPVGIVVVDYLGLVEPPANAPRNDRRVQVDAISRSMKRLAMELRVPVVAMAQVNRGPEARQDKMPTAADLRESGGQEQDADVVMVLHRDPNDASQGSTLHMGLAKNRHGPMSRFEFAWQGHYSRFVSPGDWPNP